MRILVAEDEKDLNHIIARRLTSAGYIVDSCYNGPDALDYIYLAEYNAVILDIMLPGKNGFEIISEIRANGNITPMLFLTALDSISDRVNGLDLGADDYLIKPFSFDELLARIRVITRKSAGNKTNIYTAGDLTVDCLARTASRGGRDIKLSSKEFALLEYMIRNKGIVLTREKIENNLWSCDYSGDSNVIDVYIRFLRKKIDDNSEKKLIHTIRGTGYVLKETE